MTPKYENQNILVTSAGRRALLVRYFVEELNKINPECNVHALDLDSRLSSACQYAHVAADAPHCNSDGYGDFLLNYCVNNSVGLVVPTIDTELEVLSMLKDSFEEHGIVVLVSSNEIVKACNDKFITKTFFDNLGIKYPKILNSKSVLQPCIAKPICGSGSDDIHFFYSTPKKEEIAKLSDSHIIMELVSTQYSEYTVDAYYTRNGALRCLVPRKRLEVRGGEVSKAITVDGSLYSELASKLSFIDGAMGCLTIQVFHHEETKDTIGIEVNPRFGGGYPLSYSAGANYPAWLLKEYFRGEDIPYFNEWEPNLTMLRYDDHCLVKGAEASRPS